MKNIINRITKNNITCMVITIVVAIITAVIYSLTIGLSLSEENSAIVIIGWIAAPIIVSIVTRIALYGISCLTRPSLEEQLKKSRQAILYMEKANDEFWDGQEGFDADEPDSPYSDDIMTIETARELGIENLYLRFRKPQEEGV